MPTLLVYGLLGQLDTILWNLVGAQPGKIGNYLKAIPLDCVG